MVLFFQIHYKTQFGQQIGIQCCDKNSSNSHIIHFHTYDGENWIGLIPDYNHTVIEYNYVICNDNQVILREWGMPRVLHLQNKEAVQIRDHWRVRNNESNAFLSSAFTQSIFKRENSSASALKKKKVSKDTSSIIIQILEGNLKPDRKFAIIGDHKNIGEWLKPIVLGDSDFPLHTVEFSIPKNIYNISFKFVLVDTITHSIIEWENGENYTLSLHHIHDENASYVVTYNGFRYHDVTWRGSGVAVPVFSLRSNFGFGIGEFNDLSLLVDWASNLGMKMVQVLPVNDTIANKTWVDSYPYAAISVFALHPLYVNLESIAPIKNQAKKKIWEAKKKELNALAQIDFDQVLTYKLQFFKELFVQEYNNFMQDKDAINYIKENEKWLFPYALFCHLRDKYNTANFNLWKEHSVYKSDNIKQIFNSTHPDYKEIEFYFFIQYHADKQLLAVKKSARQKRVVLKGDLPIGIYRYSSDAWVAPELYNMDEQAGAPPDDYAVLGQNWGFPTYNWDVMAKTSFGWWKDRMQILNRYFDALRIDHILGFFRIWQIPMSEIEGTMGMFNPRLPYSRQELANYGIIGDLSRFTLPYITDEILDANFGTHRSEVRSVFFTIDQYQRIVFREAFYSQAAIEDFLSANSQYIQFKSQLLQLRSNVLLIEEPGSHGEYYNPRITLPTTYSFRYLDNYSKNKITAIYNDYYFHRHNQFWKQQALDKLPAILDASSMLICGEDLGMIPKTVPEVMRDMNIMTLEIQRMPKGNQKYGQVQQYPYYSVASPSCHDMSTIRGWWESDHENAKNFFYNYLHWQGLTPMSCNKDIVRAIIDDHLTSPSMLAIFPLQDLFGINEQLRNPNPMSEQINEPSNPKHYWRFRFHIPLEKFPSFISFNEDLKSLIANSGR